MSQDDITVEQCARYVIFLDIDGVLLPVPRFTFGGGELSEACVQRLQTIIARLGGCARVSIILSSTWRTHPEMVDRLNDFFCRVTAGDVPTVAGGTPNGTIKVTEVDYYPDDLTERRLVRDRVDEIHRWIVTHMERHPEAVGGRWFAVDDMRLDVDARMSGHFLHTVTEVGLTDDDVARALAMVQSYPSPEQAYARARAALIDPCIKNEEIDILQIQRTRLEESVTRLQQELQQAHERIAQLSREAQESARAARQSAHVREELRQRVALLEYARKNEVVRQALELAGRTAGPARKALDGYLKRVTALLCQRKDIEKQRRTAAKQRH